MIDPSSSHRTDDQVDFPLTREVPLDAPSASPATVRYFGDYALQEEIARGGMGIVYRAQQISLNRTVALKMILADTFASSVQVERFRLEAEAAAGLDHPHIVPIYEVGEHDSHPYFSMKLVVGGNLSKEIPQLIQNPRRVAGLLATVAEAVHHAHQRGILHRDLKPANILLDTEGQPYVTDFGLAKRSGDSSKTQTGAVLGTPSYMPPEQAVGRKDLSTAADVYSLGAILYECLTGRPPFKGESTLDTLLLVQHQEPARPHTLNPHVSRDLETICLKCLEKEPRQRYTSALELAEDLRAFLDDKPIRARPLSPWERGVKWCRRNRTLAALLVVSVVTVVAIGILGVGLYYGRQLSDALAAAQVERDNAEQQRREADRQRGEAQRQKDAAEAQRQEADRQRREADRQRALVRPYQYLAEMNLAQAEWQHGQVTRARHLLEAERPKPGEEDLRGFEWHFLYRLSNLERLTFQGHGNFVFCIAYSADGRSIVSGDEKGVVKVWDAATGKEKHSFSAHKTMVYGVAFSPDGSLVASVGHDGAARLWDLKTGQARFKFDQQPPIRIGHHVAFSPQGDRLAVVISNIVKLFDVQTGREELSLETGLPELSNAAFSPDGSRLATVSTMSKRVVVWNVANGKSDLDFDGLKREAWPTQQGFQHVHFTPDGRQLLAAGNDGVIRVWDARTGLETLAMQGHSSSITGLSLAADGWHLASSSNDRTVRLWDVRNGQQLLLLRGYTALHQGVAMRPDGRFLAGILSRDVQLWEIPAGQELRTIAGHEISIQDVALHPDNRTAATAGADQLVKLWDLSTGKEIRSLQGHAPSVRRVAFSPDGKWLISAGDDAKVKVWDPASGKNTLTYDKHPAGTTVVRVAVSPDSQLVASAGMNEKAVHVWELRTGRLVTRFEEPAEATKGWGGNITCLAFSPDGRTIASGSQHWGVKVWEPRTGAEIRTLEQKEGDIEALAYSRDGTRLAMAGRVQVQRPPRAAQVNGFIRIWDMQTGESLLTIRVPDSPVQSVDFSPDGQRLVSAGGDGLVRLWDVRTGLEILSLPTSKATVAAFTPNGHWIVSAGGNRTIKVWDGTPEKDDAPGGQ